MPYFVESDLQKKKTTKSSAQPWYLLWPLKSYLDGRLLPAYSRKRNCIVHDPAWHAERVLRLWNWLQDMQAMLYFHSELPECKTWALAMKPSGCVPPPSVTVINEARRIATAITDGSIPVGVGKKDAYQEVYPVGHPARRQYQIPAGLFPSPRPEQQSNGEMDQGPHKLAS